MGRFSDLIQTKPQQDFSGAAKMAMNWLEEPNLTKPKGRFSDLAQGRRVSFGGTGHTGTWPAEGEQEIKAKGEYRYNRAGEGNCVSDRCQAVSQDVHRAGSSRQATADSFATKLPFHREKSVVYAKSLRACPPDEAGC